MQNIRTHVQNIESVIGYSPHPLAHKSIFGNTYSHRGIFDIHQALITIGKHQSKLKRMRLYREGEEIKYALKDPEGHSSLWQVRLVSFLLSPVTILLRPIFSECLNVFQWLKSALFHPESPQEHQMDFMQWLTNQTLERETFLNNLRNGSIEMDEEDRRQAIGRLIQLNNLQAAWIERTSIHLYCQLIRHDLTKEDTKTQALLKRYAYLLSMLEHQLYALEKQTDAETISPTLAKAKHHVCEQFKPKLTSCIYAEKPLLEKLISTPILGPVVLGIIIETLSEVPSLFHIAFFNPSLSFNILFKTLNNVLFFGGLLLMPLMYSSRWTLSESKTTTGTLQHHRLLRILTTAITTGILSICINPVIVYNFLICMLLTHYAIYFADKDTCWPIFSRRLRHFIQPNGRPSYFKGLLYSTIQITVFLLYSAILITSLQLSPSSFFTVALILAPSTLIQTFVEEVYFRSPLATLKAHIDKRFPYEALHPTFRTHYPRISRATHLALTGIPITVIFSGTSLAFGFAHFGVKRVVAEYGLAFPFAYLPFGLRASLSVYHHQSVISATIDHWLHNLPLVTEIMAKKCPKEMCNGLLLNLKPTPISPQESELALSFTLKSFITTLLHNAFNLLFGKALERGIAFGKKCISGVKTLIRCMISHLKHFWHTPQSPTDLEQPVLDRTPSTPINPVKLSEDQSSMITTNLHILRIPPNHSLFDQRSTILSGLKPNAPLTRFLRALRLFAIAPSQPNWQSQP